jgi:NADH-quinone oxidoreductase subunit C
MSEEKKVEHEGVDDTATPAPEANPPAPVTPEGLERAHPSVPALQERFPDAFLRHQVVAGDEHVVFVAAERSYEILQWLKESPDHAYTLLADVTAVDYGGGRPIQVVYQLFSIPHRRALRVKVELPLDALEVESVVPLWAAADWLEREVWDMFGVRFRNHPDLRRILMPENYGEGHPLRKDFPLRGRFSRAEQTRRALGQEVEDYYIPADLGPGREPQLVRWRELAGAPPAASPAAPASTPAPSEGVGD